MKFISINSQFNAYFILSNSLKIDREQTKNNAKFKQHKITFIQQGPRNKSKSAFIFNKLCHDGGKNRRSLLALQVTKRTGGRVYVRCGRHTNHWSWLQSPAVRYQVCGHEERTVGQLCRLSHRIFDQKASRVSRCTRTWLCSLAGWHVKRQWELLACHCHWWFIWSFSRVLHVFSGVPTSNLQLFIQPFINLECLKSLKN